MLVLGILLCFITCIFFISKYCTLPNNILFNTQNVIIENFHCILWILMMNYFDKIFDICFFASTILLIWKGKSVHLIHTVTRTYVVNMWLSYITYRINIPDYNSGIFGSGCEFSTIWRKSAIPNFITVVIEHL